MRRSNGLRNSHAPDELFRQGRFNKMHAHSKADAAACAKIRREQLSRARQMLAAAVLADRNVATLEALTDPARL